MSRGKNVEFFNVKAGDSNQCALKGYLLKYVYYFPYRSECRLTSIDMMNTVSFLWVARVYVTAAKL
jgi:hypothetical protein